MKNICSNKKGEGVYRLKYLSKTNVEHCLLLLLQHIFFTSNFKHKLLIFFSMNRPRAFLKTAPCRLKF